MAGEVVNAGASGELVSVGAGAASESICVVAVIPSTTFNVFISADFLALLAAGLPLVSAALVLAIVHHSENQNELRDLHKCLYMIQVRTNCKFGQTVCICTDISPGLSNWPLPWAPVGLTGDGRGVVLSSTMATRYSFTFFPFPFPLPPFFGQYSTPSCKPSAVLLFMTVTR